MKRGIQIATSLLFVLLFVAACNSSKQSDMPIKVMSYNIHIATPGAISDFNITDLEAVADVIIKEAPDLVVLQEVDKNTVRSGKASDQAKDLAELTGMHYHFAGASFKSEGEQGQAILSKYPIKEAESLKLPVPEESNGETRSIAIIVVEIEGKEVAIMTVHLDHRSDVDRAFQIAQMLELTQKYDEYPIIFGGDFNMEPDNDNFNLIKKQFKMVTDEHPLTYPQIDPNVAIDFFVLNQKAIDLFNVENYYTVDEQYASDHLPLIMELKFKK
ncbi:MAG: endonuclease/exonuclease/phosphatase family protein [Dysgonamonadaceae bacterium]|nr:endonuclease/exonuclease/phosphatase family protein [Dysgonamonadaceae bacterium]MDD4728267.1 endonuclease/exonuclease/phosphatase family protein [Dysgonamonadaceae bacterium]